jgi:GNAT superfamily N-acetyltransferase
MAEGITTTNIQAQDVPRAAQVLADAFFDDVLWRYLIPQDNLRARALPLMMANSVRYGIHYGVAIKTTDNMGFAIGLHSELADMNLGRMIRAGNFPSVLWPLLIMGRKNARRMIDLTTRTEAARREHISGKYFYGSTMGVVKSQQSKGLGRELFKKHLEYADKHHLRFYAETQSESNVAFYGRYGFRVVAEVPPPEPGLRFFIIIREPGGK